MNISGRVPCPRVQHFRAVSPSSHPPLTEALPRCLWEMERTGSCKCSLTPSQFPLLALFTIPEVQTAGQEPHFHPAAWLTHGQQMARVSRNTQTAQISPGEAALPDQRAPTPAASLWDAPNTRRGMTQTGVNTTLTKAWVTAAASTSHTQESSGPQCPSPAPAAEQFLGSHYSEKN